MRTYHFLGQGWPFPVRPRRQRLAYLAGDEKIEQSVWLILSTAPGERIMRPEFGCGIHELVFQPNTSTLRALVQSRVVDALQRWEPRIDVKEVLVTSPADARNLLTVSVSYQIRSNNAQHNLVYPFFLNESAA